MLCSSTALYPDNLDHPRQVWQTLKSQGMLLAGLREGSMSPQCSQDSTGPVASADCAGAQEAPHVPPG